MVMADAGNLQDMLILGLGEPWFVTCVLCGCASLVEGFSIFDSRFFDFSTSTSVAMQIASEAGTSLMGRTLIKSLRLRDVSPKVRLLKRRHVSIWNMAL